MSRTPLSRKAVEDGERLAAELRRLREEGSMTAVQVATLSGVSVDTVRAIEGKRVPSPSFFTVAALAAVLNVGLDDLLASIHSRGRK